MLDLETIALLARYGITVPELADPDPAPIAPVYELEGV